MRTLFSILTVFIGLQAQAADPLVACYPRIVADAGYSVAIYPTSDNGYLAKVSEITFIGSNLLGEVPVTKVNHIDGVEYVDSETGGQKLNLTIDYNRAEYENHYRGFIKGVVGGQTIPPQGMPEFADLTCQVNS